MHVYAPVHPPVSMNVVCELKMRSPQLLEAWRATFIVTWPVQWSGHSRVADSWSERQWKPGPGSCVEENDRMRSAWHTERRAAQGGRGAGRGVGRGGEWHGRAGGPWCWAQYAIGEGLQGTLHGKGEGWGEYGREQGPWCGAQRAVGWRGC
eukprot:365467-Chlamydomonas_euryale.AAC.10